MADVVAEPFSGAIFDGRHAMRVHTEPTDHEHISSSRHRSARTVHRSAFPVQEGTALLRECARTRGCGHQRFAARQHRGDLQRIFLDPIDKAHSAEMIASVLGVPFLGFALTIAIGSPLLDYIGMGLLLPLSGVCFTVGTLHHAVRRTSCVGRGVYTVIWLGALITGIGWGLVETVINPLIAALYPDDKTAKLNSLHAWWPGGLVIGGLLGVAMSAVGLGWQAKLVHGADSGARGHRRSASASSFRRPSARPPASRWGRCSASSRNPLFLVLFSSMFLTAASELAPGQWVDFALSRTVHMPGILLLVYVSALMFVMRHFAGPLVHKLSSIGLLWVSCLMASLGLVALSFANSPVTGLLAATIWGTGVCYMWPTMLGDGVGAVSRAAARC